MCNRSLILVIQYYSTSVSRIYVRWHPGCDRWVNPCERWECGSHADVNLSLRAWNCWGLVYDVYDANTRWQIMTSWRSEWWLESRNFESYGLRLWKWGWVKDRIPAVITIPERPLWSWHLRAVGKEGDELNTVDCLFGRDWSCQRNWCMKTTGRLSDWLMDHWRPTFDFSVTGLYGHQSWRNRNLL